MTTSLHLTPEELHAGLEEIRRSPKHAGPLQLIVRRPETGTREVLEEATLDTDLGLVGDNWKARGSPRTPDGQADPERQLTVMNARAAALVARHKDRWALAGDQLFIDLDLSVDRLPAGARIAIGTAILEVTAPPHNGCKKFTERFGVEATKFLAEPDNQPLRLRGINARVVQAGTVRTGDLAAVL